jgi:hypothetical protein
MVLIQLIVRSVLTIFHVISHHIGTIILNEVLRFQNWNQRCERFGYSLLATRPKDHGRGAYVGERDTSLSSVITRVDPLAEMRHVINLAAQVGSALTSQILGLGML